MKIGEIKKFSTSDLRIFYVDELVVPETCEALIFIDESDCREKKGGKKALELFKILGVKSVIFEENAISVELFNNREWTKELEEAIKNVIEKFNNENQ